jgi:hypothetical protein
MLKSYDELRKIDVTPFCDKRDGALYLNWSKCIDLLHKNGAERVYFVPLKNENGSSLFMASEVFTDSKGTPNRCYETNIEIHIDDMVFTQTFPVMNGANPVKDNSMSQQRVWNSMTRSFVKGVAIYTGLGFDLWLKEEERESTETAASNVVHDIMKVRERVLEKVTTLTKKKKMSLTDIASKMNRTEEELKAYLGYYKILEALEHNIDTML